MKELTEELVLEAFRLYGDLSPGNEMDNEYCERFTKTINQLRSLSDGEMLCRVRELTESHRGWWIEADGIDGFITDVEDMDKRHRFDNRWVVIDGKMISLWLRSIVVIDRRMKGREENANGKV